MKKFTVVVGFVVMVFFGGRSWGQNLVENGSFEQLTSCPPGWNCLDSCVGWFTETGSPDAIATCSPPPYVSVPNNYLGFQYPFEGDNYAGLITYASYQQGNYAIREVFGTKLTDSLVIGNTYHFSIRVCQAYNDSNNIVIATNHLGAKFSKVYHTDYAFAHDNLQQLYEDSIITDSINWTLLEWDYVADSAYKYVYLGNMFDNAHTDTLNAGEPYLYAYYYIDSVNLFCLDANCATGIEPLHSESTFSLYPNPVQNLLTLNFLYPSSASSETIAVYDVAGRKMVLPTTYSNNKAELTTTTLPNGIYLVQIINNKTGRSEVRKFVKE